MKKSFFICLLFFILELNAFANCFTGAACSLSELEETQNLLNNEFVSKIHKYFDKTINEDLFFTKNNSTLNYNDLFIFSTIV